MKHIRYLLVLLAVAALVPAYGQSADLIAAANAAYQAESFERAFAIIADGLPETSTNTALKRQAAEALATIGVAEYGIRNFRNAYEAFRKALKYDPSNTTATQNFLRMRRELDVNNLRNEAGPRVVAAPVTAPTTEPAAATGAAAGSTATGTAPAAVPAGTATTTEPPAAGVAASVPVATAAVDLSELKTALEQADARLLSMESSVTSTNQENAQLRAAAEQQLRLLESLIAAQASTQASAQAATQAAAQAAAQAASRPTAAPAAAAVPVQSAAERELIAQTMALLAAMSEREAVAPQVVVQSDPELVNLMARLDEQGQVRQSQQNFNVILLIVVLVLGGGLIVFFLIFFLLVLRARKRSAGNRQAGYEGDHPQFPGPQSAGYLSAGQPAGETRLLEFIGSTSTAVGRPVDFDVRKDLLKAERLKRMYDEVRNGTLSWNTVRDYVGELDVALKSEILKVVEQKLSEGDLLSSEAVLPIIFPFMTDFDDYIRDKSEQLAKQSLIGTRADQSRASNTAAAASEDADPLSVRNLMDIPKALKSLFKNQDQSLVTAKLCRGIGNILGLATEECNLLYKTALAHDCGYLMLDQNQLQRTIAQAEINEEDFTFIQSHVLKGTAYFGDIELPEAFKEGLLHHHERNDGSGYPDGLRKDSIHLFAKILGVAETFSALVSKRAHRDKRDIQYALAIITDGTRSKFDANIVDALVKVAASIGGQ